MFYQIQSDPTVCDPVNSSRNYNGILAAYSILLLWK
jgi:hypothetical protein